MRPALTRPGLVFHARRPLRHAGLLLLACVTGTAVNAQTGGTADGPRLERLRTELHKRYTAADRDGDGLLDREEARQGMPMVGRAFDAIDRAGSGRIDFEQIMAWAARQRPGR